jgi:hypothetical protein
MYHYAPFFLQYLANVENNGLQIIIIIIIIII